MPDTNPLMIFMVSLGCPKNLVDSEVMTGQLLVKGFGLTMDQNEADIYVINTCAFIESARQDAFEAIEEGVSWKEYDPENRMLVVTGCLIQWDKDERVKHEFPEVDLWTGLDFIPQLPEKIAEIKKSPKFSGISFRNNEPCYLYNDETPRFQWTLPHLAYLKIGEGCNNRCSYCSIPDIRGTLRSREIPSLRKEAENLIKGGVKELILIAQDITAFGHDSGNGTLADLLRELQSIDADFQVRLLYAHPAHLTDEIIEAMAQCSKVIHYLDLPLQHIADPLLTAMRRHVTRSQIEETLGKLKNRIPDIAIRTTFITGFPGETEAHFNELKEFVKKWEFNRLGVFSYSPEAKTPAAQFETAVSPETAVARAEEIMKIQGKISLKQNQQLVGKEFSVIIDQVNKKHAVGRTYMDAPEIDNIVQISPARKIAPGDIVEVRICGCSKYELFAEPIKPKGSKK